MSKYSIIDLIMFCWYPSFRCPLGRESQVALTIFPTAAVQLPFQWTPCSARPFLEARDAPCPLPDDGLPENHHLSSQDPLLLTPPIVACMFGKHCRFQTRLKTQGQEKGNRKRPALGNEQEGLNASQRPHPISRPGRDPQTSLLLPIPFRH